MPSNQKTSLDDKDNAIIAILSVDSRTTIKDIAAQVDLSAPSVTERIRRLTRLNIITAFTIDINSKAMGYSLEAIVRIKPLPGQLHFVKKALQDMTECIECDEVTGEDCFIARICLPSISDMDDVLAPIKDRCSTNTSIVHSNTVRRRHPLERS